MDKHNGTILWQYDIKEDGDQTSFHGDPVLSEDLYIIATDSSMDHENKMGHIYAFDITTGKVRWKHLSSGVPTDVTAWGDNIYGVTHDDDVLCLDRKTGEVHWRFESTFTGSLHYWRSLGLSGNRLYFAGADTVLYALDAETGDVLWKRAMPDRISSSVTAVDESVYLGTDDGYLHLLDAATGKTVNTSYVSEAPKGTTIVLEDRLLFLTGDKTLNCMDLDLTQTFWWQDTDLKWTSPRPFFWGNRVLIGDDTGQVFAFSLEDGATVWQGFVDGTVRSIGTEGDILFVGTLEGGLTTVRPRLDD